jgi:hypothetical protein
MTDSFAIMLKPHGAVDYRPVGTTPLEPAPQRDASIAFDCDGRRVHGTVDAVFIPPGCEENCVGTVFVSESRP